jgi:hypothetical protein
VRFQIALLGVARVEENDRLGGQGQQGREHIWGEMHGSYCVLGWLQTFRGEIVMQKQNPV